MENIDTDVLICGAGPTGLTLACDLARRGVSFRIIDKAKEPFIGSRGKGVQPRTQEVFDDLGILEKLHAEGAPYPQLQAHLWFFKFKWHMHKCMEPTQDVPYPNIFLVPQGRTEKVLREQLAHLGHHVEQGTEVIGLEQNNGSVTLQLQNAGEIQTVSARYVVAADGGRSFIRKSLGIDFVGSTMEEERMIVGDLHVDGLSRDAWHVWPRAKGGLIGLCPLPHSDLFQLMMKLPPSNEEPELSEEAIQARWIAATGLDHICLHNPVWLSLFRANIRMVNKFREGRVFLAGDAAHVHTPAGAQGLNTGIQDAYNLGWKLAMVLRGASSSLLDTYQEERLPIAANVLGLSTKLYEGLQSKGIPKIKRGDAERQLLLNYRSSSLSKSTGARHSKLQAGDRAPDAECIGSYGHIRLFDLFRGPHFTLLIFGINAALTMRDFKWNSSSTLQTFVIHPAGVATDNGILIDTASNIRKIYDINDDAIVLIRPDGYIGLMANEKWFEAAQEYRDQFLPT